MYDAAEVKQHIARQELKKLQEVDQVREAKLFDAKLFDAKLNYWSPTRTTFFEGNLTDFLFSLSLPHKH